MSKKDVTVSGQGERSRRVSHDALGTGLQARDGRRDRPGGDARLSGMPNSEILEELARQSGAEIRGQVREPREVTADFESVPLPEALARLLGEQNFALVYGKGGRLKAVRLLGGSQEVAEASAKPAGTTLAAAAATFPGSLAELIDRHPPVPVTGQLADALGAQIRDASAAP